MFALVAVVVFALAAFGPDSLGPVELVPFGLGCIAAHLLFGSWPVSLPKRRSTAP